MFIDTKTQLFKDISPEVRREMLAFCESVVIRGEVPQPHPPWVKQWLDTVMPDHAPHNILLYISTVIPQRVTLSLLQDDPYVRIGALGGALMAAVNYIRETNPKRADEIVESVRAGCILT